MRGQTAYPGPSKKTHGAYRPRTKGSSDSCHRRFAALPVTLLAVAIPRRPGNKPVAVASIVGARRAPNRDYPTPSGLPALENEFIASFQIWQKIFLQTIVALGQTLPCTTESMTAFLSGWPCVHKFFSGKPCCAARSCFNQTPHLEPPERRGGVPRVMPLAIKKM